MTFVSKLECTFDDIIGYIEERLQDGVASENEYKLYNDYQGIGEEAFFLSSNKLTVNKIARSVNEQWNV